MEDILRKAHDDNKVVEVIYTNTHKRRGKVFSIDRYSIVLEEEKIQNIQSREKIAIPWTAILEIRL